MTSEYVLYCFAESGNAYKAALITDEIGVDLNHYPAVVRWLQDIKALDGWVHPYELMPGHPLQYRCFPLLQQRIFAAKIRQRARKTRSFLQGM